MILMRHTTNHFVGKTKLDISRAAAPYLVSIIVESISEIGKASIILPVGSSPKMVYELLTTEFKGSVDWSRVYAFTLDELYPVSPLHQESFIFYLTVNLFSKVPIPVTNICALNGEARNIDEEAAAFEKQIRDTGGIDISLLGVGSDGHIGMNFPGSSFSSITRKVLLPSLSRPDPKNFREGEIIPEHGITAGIATLSGSKHIILLADGEKKRAALQELLSGKPSTLWPVTALQNHPGLKLFITEDVFGI